jgi:23S rRNA (cytosine1962-C5)-methyltransferase
MTNPQLRLKPGKDKPVVQRHPWIFSGALEKKSDEALKDIDPGSLVDVVDHGGKWLASGYFNPKSQIRCRVLSWDQAAKVDVSFWEQRLDLAFRARKGLFDPAETTGFRLVHAEADLLPGLIVDRIGNWFVLQILTAGMARARPAIVEALVRVAETHFGRGFLSGIYERSDEGVRAMEGLAQTTGVLWGNPPPESGVTVKENGLEFRVDIIRGHKTGFYFDQRDSRQAVRELSSGADVLNAFCYTGGFSVAAAVGGAKSVLSVDVSVPALTLCDENIQLNRGAWSTANHEFKHETCEGDVFEILRKFRDEGRTFDLVVLDPPKFAQSAAHVDRACRGYKDINRLAMQIINPGGFLATFSCSGLISADLFQKVLFSASIEAQRHVHITRHLFQATCHPVLLSFPEGNYLKGFVCRVLGPNR